MSYEELSEFDDQLIDGLEFCTRVYALFERIRAEPDGPSRLRQRSRLEKKLLEELLPLCCYVQFNYRPGRYISVRWKNGPQTHDAEIEQHGALVDWGLYLPHSHLEVTCAMHPNEHLSRDMLNVHGYSYDLDSLRRGKDGDVSGEIIIKHGRQFVSRFAEIILQRIAEKSAKPYPENTSLIVDCSLNYLYLEDEWLELMSAVKSNLPHSSFREIFLFDEIGRYVETISSRAA